MAGAIKYASHANFSVGMVRDLPRHLLPEGAVFDATNIVITNSGSLAKRGAAPTALDTSSAAAPDAVGAQRSANTDGRSRLYTAEVTSGGVLKFGSMPFSSSLQTLSLFTSSVQGDVVSDPTTFGDSTVFGVTGNGVFAWCGGADFSETSAEYSNTSVSVTTTANDATITVGSTPASNMKIGGFVHLRNASEEYTGRILNVGSTTITVDPAPTRTTDAALTSLFYYPVLPQVGLLADNSQYVSSAGCIGTYAYGGDSRLVLGNVRITSGSSVSQHPNRIMWSVSEASDRTVAKTDGLVQATRSGFPKYNFIDIEDIEQIIALVPLGSSNMLVVGTKQCVLLTGSLKTEVPKTDAAAARGGSTAAIRGFPQKVGCISAKSVQRTSAGVMFAAKDGVYITDGASMVNTMNNKISNLWESSLAGGTIFTFDVSSFSSPPDAVPPLVSGTDVFAPTGFALGVYGSANINDSHYYISLASGGYLCDLRSQFGWTKIQAGQLEISGSVEDADQTSNRVYAVKHDADASSSSVDRVIRLDPVVAPASTAIDADGSIINASITTKAYAEGDPAQKRRYRHTLATYQLIGGQSTYPSETLYPSLSLFPGSSSGQFTVTAVKGLDGAGSSSSIGLTAATVSSSDVDRYDHQTISQAVTYTFETIGAPPAFQLYQITNGFNQLRPGRVS